MRFVKCLPIIFLTIVLCSCGGNPSSVPSCPYRSLTIMPQNQVADHLATTPCVNARFPGEPCNPVDYEAIGADVPPGCLAITIPLPVQWSVSDTQNVTMTLHDQNFATVRCIAPTPTPIAVTATLDQKGTVATGTTTLTCH